MIILRVKIQQYVENNNTTENYAKHFENYGTVVIITDWQPLVGECPESGSNLCLWLQVLKFEIKVTSYFCKVAITSVWLYKCNIKFTTELWSVKHVK